MQTRATWLAAVDEMAAVCNEAQRRRVLRLVRAPHTHSPRRPAPLREFSGGSSADTG